MQFLTMSPSDARVAQAVLEKAGELRHDYDKALSDYTAAATAKAVVPPLLKGLSRVVSSLWRAARG